MADPRTVKLAEILVNHSITVKKGSKIVIEYQAEAHPLAMQCYIMLLRKERSP
jgi:leucyl aminopeptidase (aminopeptidase T)